MTTVKGRSQVGIFAAQGTSMGGEGGLLMLGLGWTVAQRVRGLGLGSAHNITAALVSPDYLSSAPLPRGPLPQCGATESHPSSRANASDRGLSCPCSAVQLLPVHGPVFLPPPWY